MCSDKRLHVTSLLLFLSDTDFGMKLERINTEVEEAELGCKLPSCVASTQGQNRKIFFVQSHSMMAIRRYIIQNSL